jgi:hypothetical protein
VIVPGLVFLTPARRLAGIALVLSLASPAVLQARAEQDVSTLGAQDQAPPRVAYRASVEWITAARGLAPAETPLNPGNARFQIPQLWAQTDVRPNLRVDVGSRITAVVRPRGVATAQSAWAVDRARADARDLSANWTEAYVTWRPSDVVQVTYGLQNFQWGPAELLAPSNRIFHETGLFRDQLYYVRGRHLLRVNLSAGKEWSVVALAELGDNGDEPFVAREPFGRQGQVKLEYSAPSGRGYVGGTVGGRQDTRPWFGEYASVALTDGLSAYVDATHAKGSRAWYPALHAGDGAGFVRRDLHADGWRTLALAGLRYTFVSGPDARLEYVHQDAGYSETDFAVAALAAAAATNRIDLEPYVSPGLAFMGRRLALLSLRVPDLPPQKHLMVHGRYLRSLTDRSGVGFVTASLETTESLVLFASASVTHGHATAEFSRLVRASALVGTVWTW